MPAIPALRLGVLLVFLVPCTDWFITFSHLGKGETKNAIAFSPISLLLQIVLVPFYLWILVGDGFTVALARTEAVYAFVGLIGLPLLAAFLTELAASKMRSDVIVETLAWFPVPLPAAVVFVIAATQVDLVMASLDLLGILLVVFVVYLAAAAVAERVPGSLFRLPIGQGRVLAFSMGTRNSFVVLPVALALPASYELAAVAIVFQSLVELFEMAFYLWWIPTRLFPSPEGTGS